MKLLFIFPALAVAFVPGYWQPLPGQAVHDLALVYGEAVTQLFKSPWNPSVPNVDLIFAEITYTVEYRTIPAAAAAASVSWETRGSSMFLKVPAGAAAAPATRPDNRMGPTSVAPAPAAPTTTSILWSTSMVTVTVMQPSSAPSTGPGVLPRIANVCSSCTIAFPDEFIFTCACGGKTIRGNMNDYIRNNQGKIEPGSKGNYRDSCPFSFFDGAFTLRAYCYDTIDRPGKIPQRATLDLGSILYVDLAKEIFSLESVKST